MRIRSAVAVTLSIATLAIADEPGTPTPPPDAAPPPAATTPAAPEPPVVHAAAPDPMAAPWSIGAGLGTTVTSGILSAIGLGLTSLSSTAPVASITLERKLTPKTSLIGGLTMSASSTDSSPTSASGSSSLSIASQSVAIALGVRHIFIGDPQVVALSGDLALDFGYARSELIGSLGGGSDVHTVSNQGQLQLIGGFSVEHLLLSWLSLRLNVRLLGAGFNAGRGAVLSSSETSNTGFNVSIGVSPGLELRMYF